MNSIHEKEKKLEEALEKLNLIDPQNLKFKGNYFKFGSTKKSIRN